MERHTVIETQGVAESVALAVDVGLIGEVAGQRQRPICRQVQRAWAGDRGVGEASSVLVGGSPVHVADEADRPGQRAAGQVDACAGLVAAIDVDASEIARPRFKEDRTLTR